MRACRPLLPELLASDRAPSPRTLVDIFREVVDFTPQSPAVDSGVEVLTYAELAEAADHVAAELREVGVRVGDKVGVRIKSGTTDLYVAILGILCAGAAYVPVDADDPDERARVVFEESHAVAVIGNDLRIESAPRRPWFRHGSFLACSTERRKSPPTARTTMPGSSSPAARPASPRASPSPTATRRPSSTPSRGCSWSRSPSAPATA